ncbi:MAG: glycosyltransferase [Tepidamorphaceae bacterium]
MTDTDRQGLAELLGEGRLMEMPFIDASDFADAGKPHSPDNGPIRFVTVAMMRARAKLDSYRLIADALSLCDDFDWALEIAGDGPERSSVEALFAPFGARVTFAGELDRQGVVDAYARSDALLWPGFNEAYGLVYLEAQAAGLPVAALDRGPQHAVIRAGETGLLTAEDPQAFAQALGPWRMPCSNVWAWGRRPAALSMASGPSRLPRGGSIRHSIRSRLPSLCRCSRRDFPVSRRARSGSGNRPDDVRLAAR